MAKRTTIDFGIDLGTTNSAIAVQNGVHPDVIKNNLDEDTTSSAIHISKKGQLRVGRKAREQLLNERSEGDVYIEFKRRMGTDHIYEFSSSGERKTPEQMSAEILKSLCADVQHKTGEQVRAAVITVPAAFEQKQCDATKKAAEMLGLKKTVLLQEPVAAALAYGFQSGAENEYWLVFDFGGGTFDAALLKADDGVIDIINHGGNNNLGGADIDWAIVEKVVLPKVAQHGNFPDLSRKNPRWHIAIARIKHAVEVAKIELSRTEKTYLNDCIIIDEDGEEIDVDYPLSLEEVITVAKPIILESVRICQRVLKEKNMAPSMITKVILVGGPTLAPYFRDILAKELGVELDYTIDPMTVVARGAAVFAGTQYFEDDEEPVQAGVCRIKLNYHPVGPDEDFRVRGIVEADSEELSGYVIRFTHTQTGWDSGNIPLQTGGKFKADLLAEEEGVRNLFKIHLVDNLGRVRETSPNELIYTVGAHSGDQIVINSIGVEVGNNEHDILIEKGTSLPARQMRVYRTIKALKKGESGDMLSIPIVEGEMAKADRNKLQGILTIAGRDIRRDVPAQSEVEVTLIMDADRCITARAYIPLLDEEFEARIAPDKKKPDVGRLQEELRQQNQRLNDLSLKGGVSAELDEERVKMDQLKGLVEIAQGDLDAALKAEAQILALKAGLDRVEDGLQWPGMVTQARNQLDELDKLVAQTQKVSGEKKQRARQLRSEVEDLVRDHRDDLLPKKMEQVMALYFEIQSENPAFWVAVFQHAKMERGRMNDPTLAARLIEQGDGCIQRGDLNHLRQVAVQLLGLLPPEIQESIKGGYRKKDEIGIAH